MRTHRACLLGRRARGRSYPESEIFDFLTVLTLLVRRAYMVTPLPRRNPLDHGVGFHHAADVGLSQLLQEQGIVVHSVWRKGLRSSNQREKQEHRKWNGASECRQGFQHNLDKTEGCRLRFRVFFYIAPGLIPRLKENTHQAKGGGENHVNFAHLSELLSVFLNI